MPSFSASLLFSLNFLLFLSFPSLILSCENGVHSQCESAPFVPGHDLVGRGFDIVSLRRKEANLINVETFMTSEDNCRLCPNPLQGNTLQKLPVSAVTWHAFSSCNDSLYSSVSSSLSSFMEEYINQEREDWKVGLDWRKSTDLMVEGTKSNVYDIVRSVTEEDHRTFSTHRATCVRYSFQVSDSPPLSSEFSRDLERLPENYNPSTVTHFRQLIETYGTHYIRKVHLGGRFTRVTSTRTCLSRFIDLPEQQVHTCLTWGINVGLGNTAVTESFKNCSKVLESHGFTSTDDLSLQDHNSEVVGGSGWEGDFSLTRNDSEGYRNWLKTLKDHPDIVKYSLSPMYMLVPNLSQRMALKAATEDYLDENAIIPPRQPSCPMLASNLSQSITPKAAADDYLAKKGIRRARQASCSTWRGRLWVTVLGSWGLKGDYFGKTEGYVKLYLDGKYRRTHVSKSYYPSWYSTYFFGWVNNYPALKIQVWDEDIDYDDLLGSCRHDVEKGEHTFTCPVQSGGVEFETHLICDCPDAGRWCGPSSWK